MKRIFQWTTVFFVTVSAIFTIHSCQKQTNTASAAKTMSVSEQYIHAKYDQYTAGRVEETEAEGILYLIEEFLVNGGEIKAYTVTDKRLGQLVYFVEQRGNEIYAYDFITGESFQGKISSAQARAGQGQNISPDLLSLINENPDGTAAKKRRRFIGWGCDTGTYDPGGICWHDCCYYVFWINTGDCCTVDCSTNNCR